MNLDAINAALVIAVDWAARLALAALLAALLLLLIRLLRGPNLIDRAAAVDASSVVLIGIVLLLGRELSVRIDGAILLSLIGFAGTLALAAFVSRNREDA
jgi:multisubunit Na+/H+ antiporter MnhF subunit